MNYIFEQTLPEFYSKFIRGFFSWNTFHLSARCDRNTLSWIKFFTAVTDWGNFRRIVKKKKIKHVEDRTRLPLELFSEPTPYTFLFFFSGLERSQKSRNSGSGFFFFWLKIFLKLILIQFTFFNETSRGEKRNNFWLVGRGGGYYGLLKIRTMSGGGYSSTEVVLSGELITTAWQPIRESDRYDDGSTAAECGKPLHRWLSRKIKEFSQ